MVTVLWRKYQVEEKGRESIFIMKDAILKKTHTLIKRRLSTNFSHLYKLLLAKQQEDFTDNK